MNKIVDPDRRQRDIKFIHAAARELGMDRDAYENMLFVLTRQRSCSQLDYTALQRVREHLRKCGAGRASKPNEWSFVDRAAGDRIGRLRYIIVLVGQIGIQRGGQKRYVEGIAENMDATIRVFKDGRYAGERSKAVKKPLEFCTADELGDIVNALEKHRERVQKRAKAVPEEPLK